MSQAGYDRRFYYSVTRGDCNYSSVNVGAIHVHGHIVGTPFVAVSTIDKRKPPCFTRRISGCVLVVLVFLAAPGSENADRLHVL